MFHTADVKDIIEGKITDVYFERTMNVLKAKGVDPRVKAEFIAKNLPENWPWAVLAGLEEALTLMKGLAVRVRAMKEGSIFHPFEPVIEIEGKYQDFCVYETALLGFICQASGIATKAARFRKLAGEKPVISFVARRMHPVLAPMIERNAYIGGCDGVSVVKSGEMIGEDPMGTMPHSLILCMGTTLEAVQAYDEILDPKIRRVALIDTFQDEKFECLNVAEAMGERLYAVRFDTPSSRRGNFLRILEEARWEMDLRGYQHVKFYVSGGIKEADIPELNRFADGYGIGTSISDAPVVDFSMDIVEIEGKPLAKRGKWSGSKRVMNCRTCTDSRIVPNREGEYRCKCGKGSEDLLAPVLDNGNLLLPSPSAGEIRSFVINGIRDLPLE